MITEPTTVNVGPGRAFSTLRDALAAVRPMLLLAPLTIQVDDGVYAMAGIRLADFAFPSQLIIRGNPTGPTKCELQATVLLDAGAFFHFVGRGVNGLRLTGFTLRSSTAGSGTAILLSDGADVYFRQNPESNTTELVLANWDTGLHLDSSSRSWGALNISLCVNGVRAEHSSTAHVAESRFTGTSSSLGTAMCALTGSRIHAENTTVAFFAGDVHCAGSFPVFAHYSLTAGDGYSFLGSATVDYKQRVRDSHSGVACWPGCGPSWQYRIPVAGLYQIAYSVGFQVAAGTIRSARLLCNAVAISNAQNSPSACCRTVIAAAIVTRLEQGDLLQVVAGHDHSANVTADEGQDSYFSISSVAAL